ncbi:uncharacterized protein QC761_102653 [Podospora bellae-mahoneyi]|uniref:Uncharacterized protein n=1 Tax=Podospora bellae-mahoneyi TaxID=2093777 RepID=A0ABR0FXI2_9PEZI|nr:hypothetical protein QC761_102653 [Podospora bellae-mahoneyi]
MSPVCHGTTKSTISTHEATSAVSGRESQYQDLPPPSHSTLWWEEGTSIDPLSRKHTNPIPTTSSRGECSASAIVTPDHSLMNSNEMTPLLSRTECSWGPESFRYARRLVSEDALPLVTTWLSTELIAIRFRIRCFSCIRSLPKVPQARTCVQRVYTGRQITGLDIGSPVTE